MIEEECKEFITLIKFMVKKPGIFGVNQVEDIWFVSLGYTARKSRESEAVSKMLSLFQKFVNRKFSISENLDWHKLIKLYSGSNLGSIRVFGELFEEFCSMEIEN
jgi:hypothetical protein